MKLTDFQEIIGTAFDLPDETAAQVQHDWPESEAALRKVLRQLKASRIIDVSGLDLLPACHEIWRYKPTELSAIQGREILYHPIDGAPIPEGASLDRLPWQMLAFLRWANQTGHLPWTDEVTIAREVKAAKGLIDDLPLDRFYTKNMLPRLADGTIDWSNVDLARAKEFVLKGGLAPAAVDEPVYFADDDLVSVLASIPALQNYDTRTMLLRGLPSRPCGNIRRSSAPTADLANIVRSVEGFGKLTTNNRWGINVLIDNAIKLVSGTTMVRQLEAFKR